MQPLYAWQEDCLRLWFQNSCRGIAHVVTGAGKTFLALGAVSRLEADPGLLDGRGLQVNIIVPKIFLVHQWASVLQRELAAAPEDIGYYYGGRKGGPRKKYMLYVVNSARYALARHILDDMDRGRCVLLIADECHHYGSAENARIFDFFPHLPAGGGRYFALGLSATPAVPVGGIRLEPFLGGELYHYGFAEALRADIICACSVFRVGVDFSLGEKGEYDALTNRLTIAMCQVKRLCPALARLAGAPFFARLQALTGDKDPRLAGAAQATLALTRQRTELVYLAENRVACALALVVRLPEEARVIIFGERIECADTLFQALHRQYPGRVGRYHSDMGAAAKKAALAQYQNGEIRILVSCKALDEGLNVPQTDVGIILSGTATARQSIQRLGRILRRTADGHSSRLYVLSVNQAGEEDPLELAPAHVHTLTYDSARGEFSYPEYESLCHIARETLHKKAAPALLAEAEKNMRLGIVRGDFRLPAEVRTEKIRTAPTLQEKNYWITMSLLPPASAL